MSRNIRQKYPAAPAKAVKRRDSDSSSSSLTDLSGDEGYSGVEDISDSEDEEAVHAAEEEHMISSVSRHNGAHESPRPDEVDEDDDANEADDDENDEDDEEDEEDELPEHEANGDEDDDDDSGSWNGILSEMETPANSMPTSIGFILDQDVASVRRHVRFAGVSDSDSDSTTTDTTNDIDSFFPDIFVAQSALDPAFRREIEYDPDDSSNSGTFWDFHGIYERMTGDSNDEAVDESASEESTPVATPVASQVLSDASTPVQTDTAQELDGYETDGDTTEEDVPDQPASRKKQTRRAQSSEFTSDSEVDRPIRFRRGQPRVGRFNLDSSDKKPVAVVNPISRKMMIFTPQRLRRLDLSPESFDLQFFGSHDTVQSSPILSNSASLMMSAMFSSNTFGDFMNTQTVGPAEAFFPFPSSGNMEDGSEESDADAEEDESERNLQLEDFLHFHHETSEDDESEPDQSASAGEDVDAEASVTPSRPTTAASDTSMMDVHPLLNHFDNNSDAVGAFRRNQVDHQLIFSNKTTRDSLAFSNGFQHGTLKGVKQGSLEAVTAPMTPARRQKRGSVSLADENKSPLDSVAQKRKASAGVGEGSMSLHKRHRSISEVEMIQI